MAGIDDLAVRQVKVELKCKLCKHPLRHEIDRLLLQRSQRHVLADGTRVTGHYCVARFREMGVENPTHENLTTHWKRHCEVVDRNSEEEIKEAAMGRFLDLTEEELREMSGLERLEELQIQGYLEMQARAKVTGKLGLSTDQILRIEELRSRQRQSDAQTRLLGALGGGLAAAIEAAVKRPELPAPAPAHPDLDAVVVREEEVVEA